MPPTAYTFGSYVHFRVIDPFWQQIGIICYLSPAESSFTYLFACRISVFFYPKRVTLTWKSAQDLDTFDTQFNQASQRGHHNLRILLILSSIQALPAWNQTQLSAFEAVLDEFQSYDNLAGVFVANEALTLRG